MSNKNRDYTRFSRETPAHVAETVENVVEETVEVVEKEPVTGVVTDCRRLNVRMEPNTKAEVVTVIDAATELMIDEEHSTDEFYKVSTAAGVEGYCMKKYVTIKP